MSDTARAIADLFSPRVAVEAGVPGEVEGELFPEEARCVERAVEKRRREFASGRLLARRALARLEVPPAPLLPAADRSPVWPDGVAGSITHTRGCCAVAAALVGTTRALGLDVEVVAPMKDALAERICTPREMEWIRSAAVAEDVRERLAKLVFSAKEAFYKCQYPLTGRFLEFHDVELDLDVEARTFAVSVRPEVDELPGELALTARWLWLDELVVSAVEASARS